MIAGRVALPSIVDPEPVALPDIPQAHDTGVQKVAAFFFSDVLSVASSVPGYCYSAIKEGVREAISAVGHELKMQAWRVYGLFLHCYDHLISCQVSYQVFSWMAACVVKKGDSVEKITDAKRELLQKSRTPIYNEAAKVFAHYIVQYLRHSFKNALTMHPEVRPKWLDGLLWKRPDGKVTYTFMGRMLHCFFQEQEEIILGCVELNLVKGISSFVDRIQKVQSDKRFAFLDLLREFLGTKCKGHFYECNAKARSEAQNPPTEPQRAIAHAEEARFNQKTRLYFESFAEACLQMLLPHGAKDLELPMSSIPASYLRNTLFTLIQKEALPTVVETIYSLGTTDFAKSVIMLEGLKEIGKAIDEQYRPNVPRLAVHYPPQDKLGVAFQDCLLEAVDYASPNSFYATLPETIQSLIAQAGANVCAEKLQTVTLQELLLLGLDKLLPALNDNGKWVKEQDQLSQDRLSFEMQPFKFEVTLEEKQANERAFQQKTEQARAELTDYLEKMGKEQKGIVQMVECVLGTDSRDWVDPQSSSWVPGFFKSVYKNLASALAVKGVSYAGVGDSLRQLLGTVSQKMTHPEHHKLYLEFMHSLAELLEAKVPFCDLRDPRYKKP